MVIPEMRVHHQIVVKRLLVLAVVGFTIALMSCGSEDTIDNSDNVSTQSSIKVTPTRIGGTGLTIDLIEGYAIDSQIDSAFRVYYFKPTGPDAKEDEAGIYFGTHPDTSAPLIEYSKRMYAGEFMGSTTQWTEYTTAKYTQREVFIDRGPDDKIHCWCYSGDPVTLEKLYVMIRSIR